MLIESGDYTDFETITLTGVDVIISGNVIIDDMVLDNCVLSGEETGSVLTITNTLTISNTKIDKTNLTVKASSKNVIVTQDGNPVDQTDQNAPVVYPAETVILTPDMSVSQVNTVLQSDPDIVIMKSGDYSKLDTLTFDNNTIKIGMNVIIQEITMNNCQLEGEYVGAEIVVKGTLNLNNTPVDRRNMGIVRYNDNAKVYVNGVLTNEPVLTSQTGKWVEQADGQWKYLFSNGDFAFHTLLQINGQTYYFNVNGIMVTGWLPLQGSWYYFDQAGHLKTGWLNLNGTWYYLNLDGIMQTGWIQDNGKDYYLTSSGAMAQSRWIEWNNHWYYLDNSGSMKKGWLLYNGSWYYLNSNGSMAVNTVINGYEIGPDGICLNN